MSISALDEPSEGFTLPSAPPSQAGPVKAWSEAVNIPTYLPAAPEKNPVFRVYPFPCIDRIETELTPHVWEAVHLENEFIRVMILPEWGGRLHVGLDKTNGHDFLRRQNVIKPVLIDPEGLSIPGGVEFNGPPLPVSTHIEERADGSRTVWCSSHDRRSGIKSTHGICLYGGRAYIEAKVRLFNRTPFVQSFFWRANYDHEANVVHIADRNTGDWRDGSFLAPYETKAFSQFWYPIQKIGPVGKATIDAAVSLQIGNESAQMGVCVTRAFPKAVIVLQHHGTVVAQWTHDLRPGEPWDGHAVLPAEMRPSELTLKVLTSAGKPLISYTPSEPPPKSKASKSAAAPPPPLPRKVETVEDLYLIGSYLQQHGHPHRQPEEYWREGLRRNPRDLRCGNALGLWHLRRGDFVEAEVYFRAAIATVTARTSHPYDGEPFYNLGLALRYQERDDEAEEAFGKAAWSFGWRAPSLYAIAELQTKRGNYGAVPQHLYEALRLNADNNNARNLAVVIFRRFGRTDEAEHLLRESLALDPLDAWACHLSGRRIPGNNQVRLDLAFDYARAGLYDSAIEVLTAADTFAADGSLPTVHYALGSFYMKTGDLPSAQREYGAAAQSSPDGCFPHRLEEMMVLARAIALQPHDARAQYYLGNLLYDRGRYEEALELWESSAEIDGSFPAVWRNLGIGYHNVRNDLPKALQAFDKAWEADNSDSRIFYERDQLWKRAGVPPALRLKDLEQHQPLTELRDDLLLELATLYNNVHQPLRAFAILSSRRFQPWESAGKPVREQYIRTHLKLGRQALKEGDPGRAQHLLAGALHGDAPDVCFFLGEAYSAAGDDPSARKYWRKAAAGSARPLSETTLYSASALGRERDRFASRRLLRELWYGGRKLARDKSPEADSSVESLPTLPEFKDDLIKRRKITGLFLQAQARFGLGQYKLARRLLEQTLTLDPNHGGALDLLTELEQKSSK